MAPDLVAILESIYRLELPSEQWLHGITKSIASWLDVDGLGAYSFLYSVSPDGRMTASSMIDVGCTEQVRAHLTHAPFDHQPEFIRRTYLTLDCCAVSQLEEWAESSPAQIARELGIYDNWGINGRNWDNHGMAVLVNRAHAAAFSKHEYEACTRISAHLAAAYRLRIKLAKTDALTRAEAVIDSHGKIEHAVGVAQSRQARELLVDATREREHARSRPQRQAGLAAWKSEVAELSMRERQVMVEVSLVRSNKEIAYSLGLAHSTVRVLLGRAAIKLGARTRPEAITRFASLVHTERATLCSIASE